MSFPKPKHAYKSFDKVKDLMKAKLIQKESSEISESNRQHWQGLLDFYIVSENLFRSAKEL